MRFYMSLDGWLNHKLVRSSRMASLLVANVFCSSFWNEAIWVILGEVSWRLPRKSRRRTEGRWRPSQPHQPWPPTLRSTFPETRSTELTVCWRDAPRAVPPGRGRGGRWGAGAPASWSGVCRSGWSHPVFQEAPGTPERYRAWLQTMGLHMLVFTWPALPTLEGL